MMPRTTRRHGRVEGRLEARLSGQRDEQVALAPGSRRHLVRGLPKRRGDIASVEVIEAALWTSRSPSRAVERLVWARFDNGDAFARACRPSRRLEPLNVDVVADERLDPRVEVATVYIPTCRDHVGDTRSEPSFFGLLSRGDAWRRSVLLPARLRLPLCSAEVVGQHAKLPFKRAPATAHTHAQGGGAVRRLRRGHRMTILRRAARPRRQCAARHLVTAMRSRADGSARSTTPRLPCVDQFAPWAVRRSPRACCPSREIVGSSSPPARCAGPRPTRVVGERGERERPPPAVDGRYTSTSARTAASTRPARPWRIARRRRVMARKNVEQAWGIIGGRATRRPKFFVDRSVGGSSRGGRSRRPRRRHT